MLVTHATRSLVPLTRAALVCPLRLWELFDSATEGDGSWDVMRSSDRKGRMVPHFVSVASAIRPFGRAG